MFRFLSVEFLKEDLSFSWDNFYNIVKAKAPTVCAFLDACLVSSSRLDSKVVVGVCVAILDKARRASASLLQCIISIVLYSGYRGKRQKDVQTYKYLHNLVASKAWYLLVK